MPKQHWWKSKCDPENCWKILLPVQYYYHTPPLYISISVWHIHFLFYQYGYIYTGNSWCAHTSVPLIRGVNQQQISISVEVKHNSLQNKKQINSMKIISIIVSGCCMRAGRGPVITEIPYVSFPASSAPSEGVDECSVIKGSLIQMHWYIYPYVIVCQ